MVLRGPNVQTLTSCRPGVEFDGQTAANLYQVACYVWPSPWPDKPWIRSIGALVRFVYQHLLSRGEFWYYMGNFELAAFC